VAIRDNDPDKALLFRIQANALSIRKLMKSHVRTVHNRVNLYQSYLNSVCVSWVTKSTIARNSDQSHTLITS